MRRSVLYIQYLGFIALGVALSITGPLIPTIRAEIPMSYLQAGMALSGQFLGMLAVVPAGQLADRIGKKAFLIASGLVFSLGLAGYAVSGSFLALLASCIVTGIGGGGYEVGINALMADQVESESGKAMNFLHFFFGVGAVGGPVVATAVLGWGIGWRAGFAVAALFPLVVTGLLLGQKIVPSARPAPAQAGGGLYRSGMLWLFGAVIALYVGIETSVYSWIPTFWRELPGADLALASITASFFWITLTGGRLLCGKLTDRIGLVRYITLAAAGVLAVSLVWALLPRPAVTLVCVFLLGLCLAGIFPTVMAHVTGQFPGSSGRVVAFLTVFSSLGGFVFPSLLGRIADSVGIGAFPIFVAALALPLFASIRMEKAVARAPQQERAG